MVRLDLDEPGKKNITTIEILAIRGGGDSNNDDLLMIKGNLITMVTPVVVMTFVDDKVLATWRQ